MMMEILLIWMGAINGVMLKQDIHAQEDHQQLLILALQFVETEELCQVKFVMWGIL